MKTGTKLSARQQALKARHKLSNRQFQQMLEMLADLTPEERASLEEPDFITEDEADIIVSNRRINEPTISQRAAEELLQDLAEDPTLVPAIEMRGHPDTWRAPLPSRLLPDGLSGFESPKHILVIRIRSRPIAYESMKR